MTYSYRAPKRCLAGGILAFGLAGMALAGPTEDATAALQRGDYAEAFRLWKPTADNGVAAAEYNIGMMYSKGLGVPQDFAAATRYLRKAADQGLPPAEVNLGLMYAKGQGVAVDYSESLRWYEKAAVQGYAIAQFNLGVAYQSGLPGHPSDLTAAASWYRKAADQGYAAAQNNLGQLYETGQGVSADFLQAKQLFQSAADHGYAEARSNLEKLNQIEAGAGGDGEAVKATGGAAGKWEIRRSTAALTGGQVFTASVSSEQQLLNMLGLPQSALLVVRCKEGVLSVYFAWPQVVSHDSDSASLIASVPQTLALMRVDDGKIKTNWLDISDEGTGAGKFETRGARGLLAAITPSAKVVVRINGSQTQDATFDTTGIDQVVTETLAACGIAR